MIYITIDDFYANAASCSRLTREEEIECAKLMQAGDEAARERLIKSYLPMVAGYIRRQRIDMQTLGLALHCEQALAKAVDSFNFLQDGEPFTHRLSWCLRQTVTAYCVRR